MAFNFLCFVSAIASQGKYTASVDAPRSSRRIHEQVQARA